MASGGEEAFGIYLNAEGIVESLVGQTASKQRGRRSARLLASNDRLRRVWDTSCSSSAERRVQSSSSQQLRLHLALLTQQSSSEPK